MGGLSGAVFLDHSGYGVSLWPIAGRSSTTRIVYAVRDISSWTCAAILAAAGDLGKLIVEPSPSLHGSAK